MAATAPGSDPRRIITQDAFSVAPQLLGLPLARPSRRLAAILLDLFIVAMLVNVGGAVLLGVAAAFAFFRFASKALGTGGSLFGRTARFALRGVGAVILFSVVVSVWDRARGAFRDDGPPRAAAPAAAGARPAGPGTVSTALAVYGTVGGLTALKQAPDTFAARAAATRVVREMRTLGAPPAEIRTAVAGAAAEADREWIVGAVADLLPPDSAGAARADSVEAAAALPAESLAVRYAAAIAGGDTAAADTLAARLGSVLARDSLDALRDRVRVARSDERAARDALEEEREGGVLATLLRLLDDLGLSFGWNALYFTAFTALWKGATPGKRLLGIRVVRLNGQPMTLWMAFERFGGYAAGLLTGLLGFAQVYWDRNRQAIHDKITETVVIRDVPGRASAPPTPAPSRPAPPGEPPAPHEPRAPQP